MPDVFTYNAKGECIAVGYVPGEATGGLVVSFDRNPPKLPLRADMGYPEPGKTYIPDLNAPACGIAYGRPRELTPEEQVIIDAGGSITEPDGSVIVSIDSLYPDDDTDNKTGEQPAS